VRRDDVQALMPRVRMFVHPEQTTRESLPNRFSEVTVRLTDGRTLVKRVDQAKGQPRNPLTDAELEVKFRDAAGRVLSGDRVDALLAAVQELETAADVRVIARLLSGGASEAELQLFSGRTMRSGRRRGRPLPRGSSWTT
jgi:2-methylcitrate dehydratase PrpD